MARKVNSDAIRDMAEDNFVEMRERVADPKFNLQKKIEQVRGVLLRTLLKTGVCV